VGGQARAMLRTVTGRGLVLSVKGPWWFPIILLFAVCALAGLRVSGSSVGIFETATQGRAYHDPNLLFGHPRNIRFDEATVQTPLTVSQVSSGMHLVNPLVGLGEDMSELADAPYLEWSVLFKPQLWPFFVLPLEPAFAFKWWLLGAGLMAGCYFFLETVLPRRRLLNVVLSLTVFFSPLIQWWYQSVTIVPVAWAFVLCALLIRLTEAETRRARVWLAAALAYAMGCFALTLYPPFQIACGLGVAAVYAGYLWQRGGRPRQWLSRLRWPAIAGLVAVAVVSIFFVTRMPVVRAIMNTTYPGHRAVPSGGFGIDRLFDGPFLGVMQSNRLAAHYDMNQSEASNFITLWPVLLIPTIYLIVVRRRERKRLPYLLIAVSVMLLVLAARVLLPMPAVVAKALLLTSVPHQRLLLGMGLLGLVQTALLVRERPARWPWWLVTGTAAVAGLMFLAVGVRLHHYYPGMLPHGWLVVGPVVVVTAATWGLLSKRPVAGAAALLILGLATSAYVNPLYRGLTPIRDNQLSRVLAQLPSAHDNSEWVLLGGGIFTNFLPAQGVPSYSTSYLYPQLDLWRRYDPTGAYNEAYDRYANMRFVVDPDMPQFVSDSPDTFAIRYDPCDPRFGDIKHVLAEAPVNSPCLVPVTQVKEPAMTFYLYDVTAGR
jgi:hypothetical protein